MGRWAASTGARTMPGLDTPDPYDDGRPMKKLGGLFLFY